MNRSDYVLNIVSKALSPRVWLFAGIIALIPAWLLSLLWKPLIWVGAPIFIVAWLAMVLDKNTATICRHCLKKMELGASTCPHCTRTIAG